MAGSMPNYAFQILQASKIVLGGKASRVSVSVTVNMKGENAVVEEDGAASSNQIASQSSVLLQEKAANLPPLSKEFLQTFARNQSIMAAVMTIDVLDFTLSW